MINRNHIYAGVAFVMACATVAPAFAQADSVQAGQHLVGATVLPSPQPNTPAAPVSTGGLIPYSQIGVDLNGKTMFVGAAQENVWTDGATGGEIDRFTFRTGWLFSFSPAGMLVISYKNYTCQRGTCFEGGGRTFNQLVPWDDSFNTTIELRQCNWNDGWGFCDENAAINAGAPTDYYLPASLAQIQQPGLAFDFKGDPSIRPIVRRTGADGVDRPVLTVNVFNPYGASYLHRFKSQGRREWVGGLSTSFARAAYHDHDEDLGGNAVAGLADIVFEYTLGTASSCGANCPADPGYGSY